MPDNNESGTIARVTIHALVRLVADKTTLQIKSDRRDQADKFALPMFMLSLLFLLLLAGIIITWVDIPRVAEIAIITAEEAASLSPDALPTENLTVAIDEAVDLATRADFIGKGLFIALLCIWPLFWLEFIYNYTTRRREDGSRFIRIQPLLACLVPPLRIGAESPAWDDRFWLPSLSWQHSGRELSSLLEETFNKPMLVIALLILPILLIEFVFQGAMQQYFWLRMALHLATGFIWFAFTLEFIIMISATDKKLAYVKKNWIDLAIILIPLISFLRTLRVLRLAKLAKIQKIAKLGRVYRVRSLGMKATRAMMMFGLVNKVLKITPEKRLAKLNNQLTERTFEMDELKSDIAELEAIVASSADTGGSSNNT